jgi:glycosyltransferase involved in cell wall biosynthesis
VRKGDIVHFQFALHLGLGLLYFFVARLKGAAIVLTVHDPLPHRWILPSSFRGIEKWLLRFQYRLCSRLIVHNETGRRVLRESFGLEYGSIAVIPHGPLNPIEARKVNQQAPAAAEPLRLLAFGSLRENKGLHLSIAAVQRLRQEAANRPIILTIAGALPNLRERPYWERCLRLIAEQPEGIEVRERRIGDGEVTELFAAAGAILLPYVDFYSDSGVAMLALSQGRPILATAAGGLGELLQQAHCGILIDAPTVDAVAAAIQKMASLLPEVLRRMGLNGHSHVLTQRSWRTIAERTREVYEEVVPELGASEEAMKLARACHE